MLNKEGFVLLAGKPSKWDREIEKRCKVGESLPDVQRDQFVRGRLSAQLVVTENGCYVRSASGLDEFKILLHGKFKKDFAIEWGKKWASQSPHNREFFARREDLTPFEVRKFEV
jgi:hypothetical protein